MDWTKQVEEMFKTVLGAQQAMVESLAETAKTMGSPTTPGAWEKTVDTWRGTVKKTLESQVELTRLWTESVGTGTGLPTEMTNWTSQVLDITRTMTETQTRFSESWFDLIKKNDLSNLSQVWDAAQAQKVVQYWQEATQKAVEAQQEWTRMATSMTSKNEK